MRLSVATYSQHTNKRSLRPGELLGGQTGGRDQAVRRSLHGHPNHGGGPLLQLVDPAQRAAQLERGVRQDPGDRVPLRPPQLPRGLLPQAGGRGRLRPQDARMRQPREQGQVRGERECAPRQHRPRLRL